MLRYYVLTSRNFGCLKRHFQTLPKEHTTVIINSKHSWYIDKAEEFCKVEGVDYAVTPCNGYPGRGKNSVLQHFLASDYEYMVQIDGDDILLPRGVELYKAVANSNNPPDGIQIVHSISWLAGFTMDDFWLGAPWQDKFSKNIRSLLRKHPYMGAKAENLRKNIRKIEKQFVEHCKLNRHWNYPPDSRDPMDCARLIFWSRKLAELVTFRENLMIGEDSLVNYQVRDMAYRGQISLQKVVDIKEQTYLYDLTNSGIVRQLENKLDWSWVQPLNEAIVKEAENWIVPPEFSLDPVAIEINTNNKSINLGGTNGQPIRRW